MRAITEIPANTPRPIGRTDSFLPGSVKAAWDAAAAEADEAAAAEEEAAAEEDSESAAAEAVLEAPLEELPVALDVVLVEEDVGDGVAAATVDTPLTTTAGFETEVVADALLVLVLLVEDVDWEPDEVVVDEVADEVADEVVDEMLVDPVPSEDPPCASPPVFPPEFPPELSLSNVNVHCLISCTSFPSGVMGVKMILHVCVDGPTGVFVCMTVVTVVACKVPPFDRRDRTERVS